MSLCLWSEDPRQQGARDGETAVPAEYDDARQPWQLPGGGPASGGELGLQD